MSKMDKDSSSGGANDENKNRKAPKEKSTKKKGPSKTDGLSPVSDPNSVADKENGKSSSKMKFGKEEKLSSKSKSETENHRNGDSLANHTKTIKKSSRRNSKSSSSEDFQSVDAEKRRRSRARSKLPDGRHLKRSASVSAVDRPRTIDVMLTEHSKNKQESSIKKVHGENTTRRSGQLQRQNSLKRGQLKRSNSMNQLRSREDFMESSQLQTEDSTKRHSLPLSPGNMAKHSATNDISIATMMDVEEQEDQQPSLNALVYKLTDPSAEEELVSLFKKIKDFDGFPARLQSAWKCNSVTDAMFQVLRNNPDYINLVMDDVTLFADVKRSQLLEFAEGIRANVHMTSLTIQGLPLGDDFLYALGSSIKHNFTLRAMILSRNCFTSAGLLDFCCCLSVSESLMAVDITQQKDGAHLLEKHEKTAATAIVHNKYLRILRIDAATEKFRYIVKMMEERNTKAKKQIDYDKKLIKHFRHEADRAERFFHLNRLEEKLKHGIQKDFTMLCNLANIASINKESPHSNGEKSVSELKNSLPLESEMLADGAFLNSKFISKFLQNDNASVGVLFNFKGQSTLFQKFSPSHEAREVIVDKFVDALLNHKKAEQITQIIMSDSSCGDDFVIVLCKRCLENPKFLAKLFILDLSNNFISDPGVIALAECISSKQTWRYLQVLKVAGQHTTVDDDKVLLSPETEFALTKAVCQNLSLLSVTIKIEGLAEKKRIANYLARNLDLLEQARTITKDSGGDSSVKINRTRNDLEQEIDKLALNDPAVWCLDSSEDQRFLSLKRKDILKIAKGLASNKFVTEVRLDRLELDDEFAEILGGSIATNSAIRILSLEGNAIGPNGIKALVCGLAQNDTIVEIKLRGQSMQLSPTDENKIISWLGDNKTIRKLDLDISGQLVREELLKRLAANQQSQWNKTQRRSLPMGPTLTKNNFMAQRKSMD